MINFLASCVAGAAVALTMTPFDVVATRLYNQSKLTKYAHNISPSGNQNYFTQGLIQ